MAQVFKHEAKKRNIQILYSKLPESVPIADMVIVGVMEVFDELHSLVSKEKGLAGMAENVRQGFRVGGCAPKGYQLIKIPTGAMREGEAVTKSKLEPNKDAPAISRYLKMRAQGISRTRVHNALKLGIAKTSAVGIEWNALTYAGHTVWNVHNENTKGSGYKGGNKRRPRSEWIIAENTHEALITTEEAEVILSRLEQSSNSRSRRTPANYLLTRILKTPNGDAWHGDGGERYATKTKSATSNRKVCQQQLEQAVLDQVMTDLLSPKFVKQLTREAVKYREAHRLDPAGSQRTDVAELARISHQNPERLRRTGADERRAGVRCIAVAMDRMKPKCIGAWTSQRRDRRFQDTLFFGQIHRPQCLQCSTRFHSRLVRNAG
jgi:hypothetical protein